MSHPIPARRRRALALIASLGLATAGLSSTGAATAAPPAGAPAFPDGRYIVLLADTPAAAYEGKVPGYARTKPSQGRSYA